MIETHVGWVRGDVVPMAIAVALSVAAAVRDAPGLWRGTPLIGPLLPRCPCVYGLLCVAFNVTTVRLDAESLTATTRPFPHWPGRRIARAEIDRARLVPPPRRGGLGYDVIIDHHSKRTTRLVSIRGADGHAHASALVSAINEQVRPA